MSKELLMIPGPTEVAFNVMREMSTPVVAHYGKEWASFYNNTIDMAKEIISTKNDLFIHVGSGNAALETVISSVVEENEKVLVLNSGFFSDRITDMIKSYYAQPIQMKVEWGEAIDPKKVDDHLKENYKKYKLVTLVHHETSTGVRNPVKEITKIVKKYGLLMFVDCVCSIGATEYKMDDWGIDFTATASQKGLGAPPGLCITSVSEQGWEAIENRNKKPSGFYLNLHTMRDFSIKYKDSHPYGITMAVNNVRALNRALLNIKEEGIKNRIFRHNEIGRFFRNEIKNIGLEIVASSDDIAASNVTVIKNPAGKTSYELIKLLKEKYNIIVANGITKLENKVIRVGHMNLGANKNSILPLIYSLKEIVNKR